MRCLSPIRRTNCSLRLSFAVQAWGEEWIFHLEQLSSVRVDLARKSRDRLVGRDVLLESKRRIHQFNVKPHSEL